MYKNHPIVNQDTIILTLWVCKNLYCIRKTFQLEFHNILSFATIQLQLWKTPILGQQKFNSTSSSSQNQIAVVENNEVLCPISLSRRLCCIIQLLCIQRDCYPHFTLLACKLSILSNNKNLFIHFICSSTTSLQQ